MAEWRALARCKGQNPDDFHPMPSTGKYSIGLENLRAMCAACPVNDECRTDALRQSSPIAFQAGMTPKEITSERTRMRSA